ncbi:MAG TPA: methyltransferase domain-containing protein [Longimicrobiales bacterium]
MPSREANAAQRGGSTGTADAPAPTSIGTAGTRPPRRPSALGLARLSHRRTFAPAGLDLYRHLTRLLDLGPEQEFLVVPCGPGATTQLLAEATGAAGAGVDPDAELVAAAAARAREARLSDRLHYEHGPLVELPYKDEVFDVVIADPALGSIADPAGAVRELVRVAKPMASVVLIQLIWTGDANADRREALVESLGVRPLLLVEWKQLLREAGVVDLYVEDWSDSAASPRQPWTLGALTGFGTLGDRLGVLLRAWKIWGWRGLQQALAFRDQVRDLVLNERILGLSLIKGTKWRPQEDGGR